VPPHRSSRREELLALVDAASDHLGEANRAREVGLAACRRVIRRSGSAVRSVHRRDPATAAALADEAEAALREAQEALAPYPAVAHAGFLHDAEKEYAEARLTAALVGDGAVPGPAELGVHPTAWLRGLAEAASELRRHLLDRLRAGELDEAEALLQVMDDVYDVLVTVDYPDAVTLGLRRTVDTLRAVLERTRGDVTTTVLQARLRAAIESRSSLARRLGTAGEAS
jgi:translin